MNNLKKNFIYNLIYQILILFIPLITAPYLARVVGAEGVGTYSYTYSIVSYFMMLILLGINNYGNRSIAKVSDDKTLRSKEFISIYLMQLTMGIIMLILYLIYTLIFANNYLLVRLIETMFIISSILDINWYFFGTENFKATITRNILLKLGSLILIFLFVKTSEDLWKYILILSSLTLVSQIIMWMILIKEVKFVNVTFKDVVKHVKPNLTLFIPVIAVSMYKIMDKIMLGAMVGVTEVGYYENAEKIISVPMAVISALGTVMLPRMSSLFAKNKLETIKEYIDKSICFIMFLSIPIMFGLIAISKKFVNIYFGTAFDKTAYLIILLSMTIPVLSFANVLRTQYLIPKEKDKIFLLSSILGAFVNVTINLILIPKLKSVGACVGTIAAEFVVMFYQTLKVRKELPTFSYFKKTSPFFIKSIIMFLAVYLLNYLKLNVYVLLLLQVLIGSIVYMLLNIKYINSLINFKKFFEKRNSID